MMQNTALPEGIRRDEETGLLLVPLDLSDQQYICLVEIAEIVEEKTEAFIPILIEEGLRQIKYYVKMKNEQHHHTSEEQ